MSTRAPEGDDHSINGVVDSDLRVHGIDRLRIVDASVIPHIPSGPISAICMAIGLRAAELILGKSVIS